MLKEFAWKAFEKEKTKAARENEITRDEVATTHH